MRQIDFKGAKICRWEAGPSVFIADPARGARLMNWHVKMADGETRDVIFWPDDADMGEGFAEVYGGNPILFPFCGTNVADAQKEMWKGADGKLRPMKKHGYARQSEFKITDAGEYGFTAEMLPSEEFKEAYPYDCNFYVSYKFSPLGFICDLTLKNNEDFKIPWAAGHHFYFRLPWKAGTKRRDYRLNISSKKQFLVSPAGELFETDAIADPDFDGEKSVNRIHCRLKDNRISFGPKNGEEDVFMRVGVASKPIAATTVVTWTKGEESEFYCIEPWMGPPNSGGNLKNASWVGAKTSQTFSVEVSLV